MAIQDSAKVVLRGRPPVRAAGNIGAISRPGCIGQICIVELVGHRFLILITRR